MTNKKRVTKERNWVLVVVSSILILIGIALVLLAIMYGFQLGWWGLLVGISGVSTIFLSVMSIIKNDPSWILLGLIIPG